MVTDEIMMDDPPPVPSNPLRDSIAQEVARAAQGMTNIALARQAGMSSRTLRAIMDPRSPRRFGRATLAKLDGPLKWPDGRAWTIYTAQIAGEATGADRETIERINAQMDLLQVRLELLERQPGWAQELIEACRSLGDGDRATVLALARRLASG